MRAVRPVVAVEGEPMAFVTQLRAGLILAVAVLAAVGWPPARGQEPGPRPPATRPSAEADPALSELMQRRRRQDERETRPTTVVNQARRLSTSLVSVRLRRIQPSWTASSASIAEPSIR